MTKFNALQQIEIMDFLDQFEKKALSARKQFDKIKNYLLTDTQTIWQKQAEIGFAKLVKLLKKIKK